MLALKSHCGAESLAYDLALRMTAARTSGAPVSGLGLDWSKCYDHVHVGVLDAISARAGIPAAISGPMLAAYRQPRRIVLRDLGGEVRTPGNGIPAGCPGATDWLALIMHLLTQPIANIDSSVQVRAYVDDITADVTGSVGVPSVVHQMGEIAIEFGRTLCLVPNLDKSCLFSTDPDIRRALRGGAFPVVDSFKDLGVIQTPSGLPNLKLAKARDLGGNDKLVRTGMVPVPFGKRCQIAAASGVPSALFGTSVQAITNQRLCSLRAAATAAIWRSPGRIATEVLYGLLAPFRADPLAGSVVRPWVFLADAIQRGVLTLGEAQWLWTASKGSTGPLLVPRWPSAGLV